MRAFIEVLDGGARGQKAELMEAPLLIGRGSECRLRLDPHRDTQASAKHCQLEMRSGRVWVIDLNSSNGTYVNSRRISEHALASGDVITFGLGGPSARFDALGGASGATARPGLPGGVPSTNGAESHEPTVRGGPAGGATPITLHITNDGRSEERSFTKPLVRLGRHPSNDVSFDIQKDVLVSSNHAKLSFLEGAWTLVDLDSTNGVWLRDGSGQPQRVTRQALRGGEEFELGLGGPRIRFEVAMPAAAMVQDAGQGTVNFTPDRILAMADREQVRTAQVPLAGEQVTIGRDKNCTVQLTDGQVSVKHAVISPAGGGWMIEDLGSSNGTFVDGVRVSRTLLRDGAVILIGGRRLEFRPPALEIYDFQRAAVLETHGLTREAGGRLILDDVSLSINIGEFVALLGPSGGGKSTLLKALNGYRFADRGTVKVAGSDLYQNFAAVKQFLGYVPQDDAVHYGLTVSQTLNYVARLRLPSDFGRSERQERVDRVLSELELIDHRHKYIHQLSGGQRKRVSIGVELLTDPKVLFLDEPTSGLDPGMEYNMMRIARELACVGRTIVMTTHAMTNIALCDKLIFIVEGKLAFFGPPAEALRYFRVRRAEELFIIYKDRKPEQWQQLYRASAICRQLTPQAEGPQAERVQTAPSMPSFGPLDFLRQAWILTERFILLTTADKWNLLFLLVLSPIIISLGYVTIPKPNPLFLIYALTPLFLGVQNASKEIVKEATVYRRERMVNLGILPYLISKMVVLTVVAAIQVAIMVGCVHYLRLRDPYDQYQIFQVCFLGAMAGVTSGLVISALVRTVDQANTLIPILLIAHVVGSGAFQINEKPGPPMKQILSFVSTYWVYDELKRAARPSQQIHDALHDYVDYNPLLNQEKDRLVKESSALEEKLKSLDEEREAAEKELNAKLAATKAGFEAKDAAPPPQPKPDDMNFPDPAIFENAQKQMKQKMEDAKRSMDESEQSRKKLSDVAAKITKVMERQRDIAKQQKGLADRFSGAVTPNTLGEDGHSARPWIGILAAIGFALSVVLLRIQDLRED